jgi:hypothetical protein
VKPLTSESLRCAFQTLEPLILQTPVSECLKNSNSEVSYTRRSLSLPFTAASVGPALSAPGHTKPRAVAEQRRSSGDSEREYARESESESERDQRERARERGLGGGAGEGPGGRGRERARVRVTWGVGGSE